jgi:putative FmdB family regulatory protein
LAEPQGNWRSRKILADLEDTRNFMPFYEYECKSCGHTLEAMQKINDAPLKKCPDCGKLQLTRLMSAPVFRLKGAGWYETDFKGDQENKKNLADRPEADAASKDEAKPAAAEDAKPAAEAKAGEPKADAGAGKEASKPSKPGVDKAGEKPAAKPAAKAAPAEAAKKPARGGISRRGAAAASVKPRPKTQPKKAIPKAKRRS